MVLRKRSVLKLVLRLPANTSASRPTTKCRFKQKFYDAYKQYDDDCDDDFVDYDNVVPDENVERALVTSNDQKSESESESEEEEKPKKPKKRSRSNHSNDCIEDDEPESELSDQEAYVLDPVDLNEYVKEDQLNLEMHLNDEDLEGFVVPDTETIIMFGDEKDRNDLRIY